MKSKMLQLLTLFLLISLFSSSKENKEAVTLTGKIKCTEAGVPVLPADEQINIAKEENTEYPMVLAPGNYMFRY